MSMINPGLMSSTTDQWWTPEKLLIDVRHFLGDYFDPCPRGAPSFDGLTMDWPRRVFCNPPYGRTIGQWTAKARHEIICNHAEAILLLVPARTDTAWMQPLLDWPICFIAGRLKFGDARNSAPFPSALVMMSWQRNADLRFAEIFHAWGAILNG